MALTKGMSYFGLTGVAILTLMVGCESDGTHVSVTAPEGMQVDGSCALDIENYSGEVSVWVDPTLATPVVRCFRLEPGQISNVIVTQRAPAWVAAEASDNDGRRVLRVLAMREQETDAAAVTLEIRTPTCDGIRVRNAGGRVVLRGVSGAVEVQNVSGLAGLVPDVLVITKESLTMPVNISSQGGSVELQIGANSAGRLALDAGGGRVEVKTIGARVEGVKTDGATWTGVLNRGDHEMKVRTSGGLVRLKLIEDGLGLEVPSAPGK